MIIIGLCSTLADVSGLRLAGGNWNGEGRVEILYSGSWGTVCDDSWDMDDARVACRELGYPDAVSALQSAHFGAGSGQIWLDDVSCAGSEDSIENCPHNGWGSHNCGHNEDAGVVCLSKLHVTRSKHVAYNFATHFMVNLLMFVLDIGKFFLFSSYFTF